MGEVNLRRSMLPGSRRRRLPSPTATDIFRFVSLMSEIGFAPPPHIMTPRRRLVGIPPETPGPRQGPGAANLNPRLRTTTAAPTISPTFSYSRLFRMLRILRNAEGNGSQPNIHPRPSTSATTPGGSTERVTRSTRPSGTISTPHAAVPNCTTTSNDQRSSTSAPRTGPKILLPVRRNATTTTDDLQNSPTRKNAHTQTRQSKRTIKKARTHKKSEGELRPGGNLAQPANDDGSVINLVVLEDSQVQEGLDVPSTSSAMPVAHPTSQINVTPIESQGIICAQDTVIATSSGAVLVSNIHVATPTLNMDDADNLTHAIPDTVPQTRAVSMLIDWDTPTPTIHPLN